jgi:8-hydroxy-5-deazaflavin:NADPH oxidoreductase
MVGRQILDLSIGVRIPDPQPGTNMNIAIIGSGSVGGTLAKKFSQVGHRIFLGVRNPDDEKVKEILSENITASSISEAASSAEVVIIAVKSVAAKEVGEQLGDMSSKIIIDVCNTLAADVSPYQTTAEGFLNWTNCTDVVKCFNTTGANNMADPTYNGVKIDLFIAGDSKAGKELSTKLAKEIGFGEIYDMGGNDKFKLQEQLAVIWINLAMNQGYGRNIAFKVLKK